MAKQLSCVHATMAILRLDACFWMPVPKCMEETKMAKHPSIFDIVQMFLEAGANTDAIRTGDIANRATLVIESWCSRGFGKQEQENTSCKDSF